MRLVTALLVFVSESYLKLNLLMVLICSAWRYYEAIGHLYIIILDSLLRLAIIVISLGMLSLVKINCHKIANYLMVPVSMGLSYVNIAHYHHSSRVALKSRHLDTTAPLVARVDLALANGLLLLMALQLAVANWPPNKTKG